jgi:hypothetical protein
VVLSKLRRFEEAARHLDAFLERAPGAGRVNHLRAAVAAQLADFDTALLRTEAALRSGEVAAETFRKDPTMSPLRTDSRFRELLRRYALSRPASAPH